MIEIKNLKKSYDGEKNVINDLSLVIEDEITFGLIGNSGAGKTTLLNCLTGLETYDEGSILIDGIDITGLEQEKSREFRGKVGVVFQDFCLLNRKNVFENIALPMRCWNYSEEDIKKRVELMAKLVGIEDKLLFRPKELSGGQKQRVAIARALVLQPKYLLCDEATSFLDQKTTNSILKLLKKIQQEMKVTIIIVTHEMDVLEKACNKIGLLKDGKIIKTGYTRDLLLSGDKDINTFIYDKTKTNENETEIIIKVPYSNNELLLINDKLYGFDVPFKLENIKKIELDNENIILIKIIVSNEKIKEAVTALNNEKLNYEIEGY